MRVKNGAIRSLISRSRLASSSTSSLLLLCHQDFEPRSVHVERTFGGKLFSELDRESMRVVETKCHLTRK